MKMLIAAASILTILPLLVATMLACHAPGTAISPIGKAAQSILPGSVSL